MAPEDGAFECKSNENHGFQELFTGTNIPETGKLCFVKLVRKERPTERHISQWERFN